jgi:hypothetical protein
MKSRNEKAKLNGRVRLMLVLLAATMGVTAGGGRRESARAMTTITVTSLNDSDPGTLRQAIADAASGDTINFAVNGTITLTSGELSIDKSLTIQGPGANLLTISGDNTVRVFNIAVGNFNVTFSGLTIANGNSLTGGGILNISTGTVNVTGSTLSGNSADLNYGGIFNNTGTANVRNTIIAGNTAGSSGPDVSGAFTSQGHNLIGKNDGSTGFPAGNPNLNNDLVGTNAAPLDPLLDPLDNNGGPTQTHALQLCSPAINAGDNCVTQNPGCLATSLTTDQRGPGFRRNFGGTVDIGAFELLESPPPCNTAPTIAAMGVTRQRDTSSNSQIATVNDAEDAENTLAVTATLQSGSGVSVSGISVDGSGNVTATVAASCTATNSDFTLEVTDSGTLMASATLSVTVTAETIPPIISCPANVIKYLPLNSMDTGMVVNYPAPTATDNCTASPTITSSPGSGSTFPVGTTTVNVTATDGAGNQASCSFTVTVRYNFAGFFQPVDNPPVVNAVNAGQAIPVKFSLSGNKGLNIFAAGYPLSQAIACSFTGGTSNIEETVTAGASSLSYDAAADQYSYVWKTDKAWEGTCRQLIVKLTDGTTHVANFQFK